MNKEILRLCAHDELYIIDLSKVLYLQADDHYTQVLYGSGSHFMVPYGLARIEEQIAKMPESKPYLVRLGRKYIVNIRYLFRVSTARETLFLSNNHGEHITIHISKPVLRGLIDLIREG